MITNYFRIARRYLLRRKGYTAINVLGLALSMACAILIFTLVNYHLGFDRFHPDADRIYRIVVGNTSSGVYVPMGKAFREEYPYDEHTARVYSMPGVVISLPGQQMNIKFTENAAFAEPALFQILDFPMLKGDHQAALSDPLTALVTERVARKYFGDADPVGKRVRLENQLDFTITGVLADIPANTDRRSEIYFSFASLPRFDSTLNDQQWNALPYRSQCFTRLKPGVTPARAEQALTALARKYLPGQPGQAITEAPRLQPIADIHFNANYDGTIDKANLWTLALIGLVLILTACVNFINLTTAQGLKRAKEIGVRKALGSLKSELFWQFITETGLIALLAVGLALLFAYLALPSLNHLMSTQLSIGLFAGGRLLFFLLLLIVVVTFTAGAYPGLVMAGFQPVVALKGKLSQKHVGGFSLRRVLVVSQLVIAQLLIIGTLVITSQMRFARQSNLGFNREAVVLLPLPVTDKAKVSTLKSRLLQSAGVKNVSFCYQPPAALGNNHTSVRFENRPKDEDFTVVSKDADEHYVSTFGLQLVAGRNLLPSDTTREFVVNETLLKALGILSPQEALGKMLYTSGGRRKGPIVGVVKDFFNNSFRGSISPICVRTNLENYTTCAVRINPYQITPVLAMLEKTWNQTFPEYVYSYQFADDQIAQFYVLDELMLRLIQVFALMAILISCLGLLGLVSFMAAQKTKEVGIRKALGAGVENILYLFGKEFVGLTLLAIVMAVPVAWWLTRQWLKDFVYRIDLDWSIFALSGVLALLIVLLTISVQTVKASLANPVTSLRSE
jgi:predicted permease